MKWVVGTGRCGMHNYTALHGGYIQSSQAWKDAGVSRYHGKDWDKGLVRSVIRERLGLPFPFVTDCAQFMFIDLIRQLDPNAEFVWLQREKKACVDSFMEKVGEDHRIHPIGWDFKYENKRRLLEWYYDEVNEIIRQNLIGAKFEHIKTEDLPRASEESVLALKVYA
jgi:hypothetical protein